VSYVNNLQSDLIQFPTDWSHRFWTVLHL